MTFIPPWNFTLTFSGTSGQDTIHASILNDVIYGYGDDDLIYAGFGADTVFGGAGDDVIFAFDGGTDPLAIYNHWGHDVVYGGTGNDQINYWMTWDDVVLYGDGGPRVADSPLDG